MAINKPFAVKGQNVTSPKGEALWCKVAEPDFTYNAKGTFSTSLVCDPNDPTVQAFIQQLEALRDKALEETMETLGAKGKTTKAKDVFVQDYDQDGNETGNIIFKFKMNNVADRKPGQNKIGVVDAKRQPLPTIPLVGNGSIIRCVAFANPYYMATTKEVGISLLWSKMQIIELQEFGGNDGFDDEDGYVAPTAPAPTQDFDDEDKLDF
jgi:hypothetical protein